MMSSRRFGFPEEGRPSRPRQGMIRLMALAAFLCLGTAPADLLVEPELPSSIPILPDERLGVRTAPLMLLSRPDVRADLGLTDSQSNAADKAIAGLYAKAASLKGKTGETAIQGRKAVDDAQKAWVDANLSNEQRDRLTQIDLQWEGPSALVSRPIVADALGLTPEQRDRVAKAMTRREVIRASTEGASDAEANLANAALAVLNDEQKARWKVMLGRPFAPVLSGQAVPGEARK